MKKLALSLLLLSSCLNYDKSNSDDDIASDNAIVIDQSVQDGSDSIRLDSPCNGILWKPESELDGTLVIVSRPGDIVRWSSISVCSLMEDGKEQREFGEFNGVSVFSGGASQVWRFNRPGSEYTGKYEIEYDGEICEGSVDDPSNRND